MTRVHRYRVDGEEAEGDRRERRREAVHVVEEIEGVRDADEPDDRDGVADETVVDQLDVGSGTQHERGAADLSGELRERRQADQIVREAGEEDERAARVDPDEALVDLERAGRRREPQPRAEPGEDADAAEHRRRRIVPAVCARQGDEPAGERGSEQQPDRDR